MAYSLAVGLRVLFFVLGALMVATLVYTISIDGLPFRRELLTPWMVATLVDFYINVIALGAWVIYKESSWISTTLWILLLVSFGSITTCAYIFWQLMRLSTESLRDPIYNVLLKYPNKNDAEQTRTSHFPVVTARIVFSLLGFLMLGTLIYSLLTDGSPFRKELFTPWMRATLIDFYINVVALSAWVAYKESTWISAVCWIALLICFGSISTCAYIAKQLSHLTSQDPAYLVLFKTPNCLLLRPDGCSLPVTPNRASPRPANGGYLDFWEQTVEEEPAMERVESGRDLRAKMFEKLSKENPFNGAHPDSSSATPDVGWISELVQ